MPALSPRMQRHFCAVHSGIFCIALLILIPVMSLRAEDDFQQLFDESDEPGRVQELIDDLSLLKERKIPVNTASAGDLLLLPFLSPADARAIVLWREQNGAIRSRSDLEGIIGEDTASMVMPFLDFTMFRLPERAPTPPVDARWDARWYREYPERRGIATGAYLGGNDKFYSRLGVQYGDIDVRGVIQKDTGEPDWDDFTSLSVSITGQGFIRRVVAGNFTVSTGQGLLFGQGRYLSKGVDPLGVRLRGHTLKPYSSSGETGFMQGAGVELDAGPLDITAFYSDNRVDASVDDGTITTLRASGYHRTESEILHKDNCSERVAGLHLRVPFRSDSVEGSIGATLMRYRYDLPYEDAGGKEGWYDGGGIDLDVSLDDIDVFAEASVTGSERYVSWIAGAGFPLTEGISSVIAVRDYHREYVSPFSGAFAERAGNASNEEGYYAGIEARILKNLRIGAYYDIFRFPELNRYYGLSSSGSEAKLSVAYRQSSSLRWELLLQHQYKDNAEKYEPESGSVYYTAVPYVTDRARLGLEHKVSRWLTLKLRGEYRSVTGRYPERNTYSDGWLAYVQANVSSGPVRVKTRYTRFLTDDYDSAIYVYEDDLPRVFSLPAYYGDGQSFFSVVSWKAASFFTLSGRFRKTWYADREVYGSGHDERNTDSPVDVHIGCSVVI